MYYIIGIWCIFLFFLTIFNFIRYTFFLTSSRSKYISQRLIADPDTNEMPNNNLEGLRPDDLLVLELIKVNTSEYELINLVKKLNKLD